MHASGYAGIVELEHGHASEGIAGEHRSLELPCALDALAASGLLRAITIVVAIGYGP